MLDIPLGDGGTVLWPLEPANAFHAAPCEHIPATPCAPRSVCDNLHTTRTDSTIDLVSHPAHLSLTALPLPHDLHVIVSLVHAQQQTTDLQSQPSIFPSACGALIKASSSPAAGLGARIFGATFSDGFSACYV